MTVKIITGFCDSGGSSTAHINLCNTFNKYGIDCTLYGENTNYFSKYCKSGKILDFKLESDDRLIIHFYNLSWSVRPPIKKLIYSCHEKNIRPINSFNYKIFDYIHYVSNQQKKWHNVNHPSFVLPNILDDLKPSTCKNKKVVGIISHIDSNKQIHVSIKRALADGMEKVYIFGRISDQSYYQNYVVPLLNKNVNYVGFVEDKQAMYNQISHVYHSSLSETFGLVEKECELTGVKYHGNEATKDNFDIVMNNEQIVNEWKRILEL